MAARIAAAADMVKRRRSQALHRGRVIRRPDPSKGGCDGGDSAREALAGSVCDARASARRSDGTGRPNKDRIFQSITLPSTHRQVRWFSALKYLKVFTIVVDYLSQRRIVGCIGGVLISYDPVGWRRRLAAVMLGTLLGVAPAAALTPFTANETAGTAFMSGPGSVSDARAFCPTGPACGSYAATASASGASGGSVQVSLTLVDVPNIGGSEQGNFDQTATANVFYGIELLGTPDVAVPVTVVASLTSTAASGYLSDGASLTIQDQVGDYYAQTCYDGTCYAISPLPVVLVSGREYLVSLQASATALANGTVSASVDPTFVIDPAYAGRFTLVGVPGAVASVPEAQSWTLFIAGFGLLGARQRRRWRVTSVACRAAGCGEPFGIASADRSADPLYARLGSA